MVRLAASNRRISGIGSKKEKKNLAEPSLEEIKNAVLKWYHGAAICSCWILGGYQSERRERQGRNDNHAIENVTVNADC